MADKDAEIEWLKEVLENSGNVNSLESANRNSQSNISVLKDMVEGLKHQLAAKDHDIERLKQWIENQQDDPYNFGQTPV